MDFVVVQLLNGMASASSLFLVASGLTVIFGVTRVVNFAHGSFYMLGAYMAYTLSSQLPRGNLGFWGGVVGAAIAIGLLGAFLEIVLLRRLYRAPELFQLLATFGVVLVVQDVTLWTWGPEDLLASRPASLRGAVDVLGRSVPVYDFVLMAVGPIVLAALHLLFHKTRWGTLVRAATQDREMVEALGVEQSRLFTAVFFLGSLLAGLGGALQLPREAASLNMDLAQITEAFVVVVVGGMGSIAGAYLAALLIAVLQAFGIAIFPKITLVLTFLVMAVVLAARPYGLLGRPQVAARGEKASLTVALRPGGPSERWIAVALLVVLALAPLVLADYSMTVLTEITILALFAASLHFLMGPGGVVSFGHAAYFGVGSYALALAMKHSGVPMLVALLGTPLAAGLLGVAVGWFCVRLSGVYLAMLTLAVAQIVWSAAVQWDGFTGGDNGLLGIWPDDWARGRWAFYLVILAVSAGGILLLRRAIFAPFGYALRAARDAPLRAEASGINPGIVQWAAFVLSSALAGVAGGLFVLAKGGVFPTYVAIGRSIDALLMVLLGGIATVTGPLVGSAVFVALQDELSRFTNIWRFILGMVIIVMVLAFPQGLVGFAARWRKSPDA